LQFHRLETSITCIMSHLELLKGFGVTHKHPNGHDRDKRPLEANYQEINKEANEICASSKRIEINIYPYLIACIVHFII
jgi:hypothetical protein